MSNAKGNQDDKARRKRSKIILAVGCAVLAIFSTIANIIYKWPITETQKIAQIGVFMVLTIYFLYDSSQDAKEAAAAETAPVAEPEPEPTPEPAAEPAEEAAAEEVAAE